MCGLSTSRVRFTSDDRRVTCPVCLRMKGEGAALFPGGGRNMLAELRAGRRLKSCGSGSAAGQWRLVRGL